jgi:cellulose synthase/poly-beta-1,6-N-acetylglucosamine synthase-like glycosyltransferase
MVFSNITIIFNIMISIYIIISLLLMYATCFIAFIKQKQIIYKFLNNSQWINMQKNRTNGLNNHHNTEDILHMIIIPIYKEDLSVIDDTLKSLAEQNVSMIIGLALEEREIDSDLTYNDIIDKYENKFLKIIKTIHPTGLKNEIAGKASNCNYCVQVLIKHYEENFKDSYNYAMITSCDCDSIWCQNYFIYLNYLCRKNSLTHFNHIIYIPNITNLKNFQTNHVLSNWMSVARSIVTHGHFRRLGHIRCFTSEYHIPL